MQEARCRKQGEGIAENRQQASDIRQNVAGSIQKAACSMQQALK
jgi:hypothetical protein